MLRRGWDKATEARILEPCGADVTPQGELLIADTGNHCLRKINCVGIIVLSQAAA